MGSACHSSVRTGKLLWFHVQRAHNLLNEYWAAAPTIICPGAFFRIIKNDEQFVVAAFSFRTGQLWATPRSFASLSYIYIFSRVFFLLLFRVTSGGEFLKRISWLSPLTVFGFMLWSCLRVPVLNFSGAQPHLLLRSKSLLSLSGCSQTFSLWGRIGPSLHSNSPNARAVDIGSWVLLCFIRQVHWHYWASLASVGSGEGVWSWVVCVHPSTCLCPAQGKGWPWLSLLSLHQDISVQHGVRVSYEGGGLPASCLFALDSLLLLAFLLCSLLLSCKILRKTLC